MPALHTLLAFFVVAVVFVAVPGPSNLYVLARGLQSGSRAAIAGAAGCATGADTHSQLEAIAKADRLQLIT